MAQKRHSKLERTAYHEAGHALVAYVERRRLRHVSIIPDEDTQGHCLSGKPPGDFHPDYDDGPRTRAWLERAIAVSLGGAAAEEHLTGRHPKSGADEDWRRAIDSASYVTGSIEETEAYLNWLWIRTKALLKQPWYWAAVKALAAELLERRRIGERRARRIIRNAMSEHMETEIQARKRSSQ